MKISFPFLCAVLMSSSLLAQPFYKEKIIVTASDYCDYLNRLDRSDSTLFYNDKMASDLIDGSIVRIGSPERYKYKVIEGRENVPISFVSLVQQASYKNATGVSEGNDFLDDPSGEIASSHNYFFIPFSNSLLALAPQQNSQSLLDWVANDHKTVTAASLALLIAGGYFFHERITSQAEVVPENPRLGNIPVGELSSETDQRGPGVARGEQQKTPAKRLADDLTNEIKAQALCDNEVVKIDNLDKAKGYRAITKKHLYQLVSKDLPRLAKEYYDKIPRSLLNLNIIKEDELLTRDVLNNIHGYIESLYRQTRVLSEIEEERRQSGNILLKTIEEINQRTYHSRQEDEENSRIARLFRQLKRSYNNEAIHWEIEQELAEERFIDESSTMLKIVQRRSSANFRSNDQVIAWYQNIQAHLATYVNKQIKNYKDYIEGLKKETGPKDPNKELRQSTIQGLEKKIKTLESALESIQQPLVSS